MARLQILELPEGGGDDRPPFVLVVDQYVPLDVGPTLLREPTPQRYQSFAEQTGARAVLVFEETIDIPGNDVPVDETGHPIKFRIEPDFETFREQVQEEIRKTQRELRQAVNGDGIDPKLADLVLKTIGIELVPGGVPLDEVLYNACRELEKSEDARKRVRRECKNSLTDALGMDRTRDWDDIHNAATGLRKSNEARGAAIDRVLNLPHQPQIMDAQHTEPTGYQHGYRIAIQDAKRAVGHQSEHPTGNQARA